MWLEVISWAWCIPTLLPSVQACLSLRVTTVSTAPVAANESPGSSYPSPGITDLLTVLRLGLLSGVGERG